MMRWMRWMSTSLWGMVLVATCSLGCSDDPDDGADADTGPAPDVVDAGDTDRTDAADGDVPELDADATPSDADVVDDATDTGRDTTDGGDIGGDVIVVDADASSDADTGPMCMSDKMCPGNAVCEEGSCRYYRFVQIKDVTRDRSSKADEACGNDSAGADLFQLELRGPFGRVLGYANTAAAELTADANTQPGDVFDGVANSLKQSDGALCPSGGFGADSVVSLGCGGSLAVAFTDGTGNIVNLATGQQLVVHEYGDQCCSDGCPDEYWEIRVCNAQTPQRFKAGEVDDQGNHPTCDTNIVEVGSGRAEVTLQLPRE